MCDLFRWGIHPHFVLVESHAADALWLGRDDEPIIQSLINPHSWYACQLASNSAQLSMGHGVERYSIRTKCEDMSTVVGKWVNLNGNDDSVTVKYAIA